jgi:hypothetical protein
MLIHDLARISAINIVYLIGSRCINIVNFGNVIQKPLSLTGPAVAQYVRVGV